MSHGRHTLPTTCPAGAAISLEICVSTSRLLSSGLQMLVSGLRGGRAPACLGQCFAHQTGFECARAHTHRIHTFTRPSVICTVVFTNVLSIADLKDVQADVAVYVDVGMETRRDELDHGRRAGVVGRESKREGV